MQRRRTRGLTLTEVLVGLAITAVLAGLAAPSFIESMGRTRLEGAISTLATDLHYTRAEAVRRGSKVADTTQAAATLTVDGTGKSYTITVAPIAGGAATELKTVDLPNGVTLTANVEVAFSGLRGIAAAKEIYATSTETSGRLKITTNALGHIATCAVGGGHLGHPSC